MKCDAIEKNFLEIRSEFAGLGICRLWQDKRAGKCLLMVACRSKRPECSWCPNDVLLSCVHYRLSVTTKRRAGAGHKTLTGRLLDYTHIFLPPLIMSNPKYILVALPATIVRPSDEDEAFNALTATVSSDVGEVAQFNIPSFKIGTLDALVLQADELAKVDQQVEAAVVKVADVLRNVCEDGRVEEHKTVNDSKALR